jgi:hypothetical protein
MPPAIDLTGQQFGKLTAIAAIDRTRQSKVIWRCRCRCGALVNVVSGALRSGNTKSCGSVDCCPRTKHGHTSRGHVSLTYTSWQAMLDRCHNANNSEYARYGARGISVCPRWHRFESFLIDMGERQTGTSIDRFPDTDGNYEPGNCRWATAQEQTINRKVTKLTAVLVQEIHGRHEHGELNASIAERLHISPCHVSLILSGAKWRGSKAGYSDSREEPRR